MHKLTHVWFIFDISTPLQHRLHRVFSLSFGQTQTFWRLGSVVWIQESENLSPGVCQFVIFTCRILVEQEDLLDLGGEEGDDLAEDGLQRVDKEDDGGVEMFWWNFKRFRKISSFIHRTQNWNAPELNLLPCCCCCDFDNGGGDNDNDGDDAKLKCTWISCQVPSKRERRWHGNE